MRKETTVETPGAFPILATNQQRSARCPKEVANGIILSFVALHAFQNPTATERIAVTINEAAGGTGILKTSVVTLRTKFRLAGSNVGMGFHEINHGAQPMRTDLDVAVQQEEVRGFNLCQSAIVAFRKTVILAQRQPRDFGKLFLDTRFRIVGGTIVRHNHRAVRPGSLHNGRKETTHHRSPVPIENDDRHFSVSLYSYGTHYIYI